jgi:hypothetical protein
MSYLTQNYFNNFQVRQPLIKNPINRAPPQQLTKSRPGVLVSNSTGTHISIEDLEGGLLRIDDSTNVNRIYTLPSANRILRELGTQSNGNPTAQWSCLTNTGDCLFINILNKGVTGTIVANGEGGSTGVVNIPGATGNSYLTQGGNVQGRRYPLTIEFTSISNGSNGVTGTYICY